MALKDRIALRSGPRTAFQGPSSDLRVQTQPLAAATAGAPDCVVQPPLLTLEFDAAQLPVAVQPDACA